jgi:oligopeptide/dipeptide ABC transporter ATP-binding protein
VNGRVGAPVSGPPLLEVSDLSVTFPARRAGAAGARTLQALDGVSLGVSPGEIVGVVGESGCGKSTLGRAIVGLVRPSSGSLRFAGEALGRRRRLGDRRRVQIVFQDPASSLNPTMTAGAAIGEALHIHGIGGRRDRPARVAALLEKVGLPASVASRRPKALSGGQKQRVSIARALAVEPDLLVADEAVSALDVSVQAQIIGLLQDLNETLGLAILFIGHDLSVIETLCDRVVVLYLGRVMESGPAEAIFRRPFHPYTRALLDAAPVPDPAARDRPRLLLGGEPPSPLDPPPGCVFSTRCPHAEPRCRETRPPPTPLDGGREVACLRHGELTL